MSVNHVTIFYRFIKGAEISVKHQLINTLNHKNVGLFSVHELNYNFLLLAILWHCN